MTKRDDGLATEQEAGDAAVNALAEALADFMWSVRDVLTNQTSEGVSS